MQFAVNYSEPARDLLTQRAIEPDLFKCPPWPELIEEARQHAPVYVHFGLNAGTPGLAETDWDRVEELLTATKTPYVSLHLTALNRHFPDMAATTRRAADADRIADALIRDVEEACRRFGPERVIVENVPYRGTLGSMKDPQLKILRPVTEPALITRVVRETGCGLLLDGNHARMAAYYMEVDPRDYMARLPVDRLRELHMVGGHHDGRRFREHMPMTDEDWAVTAWMLDRIERGVWARPWALAFEYGRVGPRAAERSRPEVLAEQVPRLAAMVREAAAAGESGTGGGDVAP